MKRAVAIVVLVSFLFNVVGYYGVYLAMVRHAEIAVNDQIESETYGADQTVTIKIPITLPYTTEAGFHRAEGDFEHHGEFYKLVKQKYSNDTLYVVCLKNTAHKKAFQVFSDFVKTSTDQSSADNHNSKTLVQVIKDFSPVIAQVQVTQREAIDLSTPAFFTEANLLNQYIPAFSPPPESAC